MQSLQADQSLYNRKGVCYISLSIGRFSGWQEYNILDHDCKDKQIPSTTAPSTRFFCSIASYRIVAADGFHLTLMHQGVDVRVVSLRTITHTRLQTRSLLSVWSDKWERIFR